MDIPVTDGWPGSEIAFMAHGEARKQKFVVGISRTAAVSEERPEFEDRLRAHAIGLKLALEGSPDLEWEELGLRDDVANGVKARYFSTHDLHELMRH